MACGLEIQATVDVTVQIPQGSKIKARVEFLCCSLKENSFFRKSQFLLLRPLTNGTPPIHIMEDNLLYVKSTDVNINYIPNISSQKNLVWQTPNLAP